MVKNTLLGLAFKEAGIEGLEEHLHGATAIAYSENGYVDAPKILSDYAPQLETTAQYLLEHETMSSEAFEAVFTATEQDA